MAKKVATKKVATKKAATEAPETEVAETFKADPEAQPLHPAYGRNLPTPVSDESIFRTKAKAYGIPGRNDGTSTCMVTGKGPVGMPNGDIAAPAVLDKDGEMVEPGDTFCPKVEGMTAARYAHLLKEQWITRAPEKVEAYLLEVAKGKADKLAARGA